MPNIIADMIKAIKDWCLEKFQPSGDYAAKSDLNVYSLITDTGKEISLSIDPNSHVMTLSLKNADGAVLSEKTINIPLESVVIGIEFDKENKSLILQLQNGVTTEPIDISDLVSGLVSDSFTIAGIDMKDNIMESELRTALSINNVENVSVNEQTPTFGQYAERNNIESGETLAVILSKIKKFFADLKPVAFSGRYDDLSDKPEKLPNPENLTFTGGSAGVYDGSSPVSIRIPAVYMTRSDKTKLDEFSRAENYALKTDINSAYKYKGSVFDETLLPENAEVGDTYKLSASSTYGDGTYVAWNGTKWDAPVNISSYVKKTELEERFGNVENKSAKTILSEMTNQEVINALGYTPISGSNMLKNVEQYTEENQLIFNKNEAKDFSALADLEEGKYYSFSFNYSGELYERDEAGIVNFDEENVPDTVDFVLNGILLNNFYFKASRTDTYTFYWNRVVNNNALSDLKIWNLKIIEGYSAEMLRTIDDIKKSQTKLANLSIDAEKDVLVVMHKG